MKIRRSLMIITTFSLLGSSVAQVNPTGFPIFDTPVTLSMMGPKAAIHGPWDQLRLFTEMEDLTNIQFTFDTPPQESFEERKNLVFASGNLPDVFFGALLPTDEITYGSQGLLIPLEELIPQYAPNVQRLLDENPEIRRSITAPDGHIYSLPYIVDVPRDLTGKVWINRTWLEALGLDIPRDVGAFREALAAFGTQDPDPRVEELPISGAGLGAVRFAMMSAFGFIGEDNINVRDGTVVFTKTQPAYREYLAFMQGLYEEALLDPQIFTDTVAQQNAKGANGQLGVFSAAGAFVTVGTERDADYVALPPLTSELSPEPVWSRGTGVTTGVFALSSSNPQPEASLRWADYLYSEEGIRLSVMGVEGQDWRWLDQAKTQWERIVPEGVNPEEYRGGSVTPNAGLATPTVFSADFMLKQASELDARIDQETETKYVPHWQVAYPTLYFTPEEQSQINILSTDMDTFIERFEADVISGRQSLDDWDNYVATLERIGAQETTQIYQTAYDRWASAGAE